MTTARMPGASWLEPMAPGRVAHHHLAPRLRLAGAHDQLEPHGHEDEQERGEPAEQEPVDRLAAQVLDHGADRSGGRRQGEEREPHVAEVVGAALLALADPRRRRVHGGARQHPARRHAETRRRLRRRPAPVRPNWVVRSSTQPGREAEHRLDREAPGRQAGRAGDGQAHRRARRGRRRRHPTRRRAPRPRGQVGVAQLGPQEGDEHDAGADADDGGVDAGDVVVAERARHRHEHDRDADDEQARRGGARRRRSGSARR